MSITSVREDAAERDVCPRCGAAAGEVCRTPSGRIAEMAHAGRLFKPRDGHPPIVDTEPGEGWKEIGSTEQGWQVPDSNDNEPTSLAGYREMQALKPVPEYVVAPRGGRRSAKGAARRERKAALRRKRGFRV